ncbi:MULTISPECIES: glycosyltransferase family 2 protein [unclassified Thalassospira]|uniref:glycosyltransferase family 2 protein n=1 Tax=unclassified Thalassospira TaxID=2648997 RepID=UPI0025DCD327|nr:MULTISPECIES: glycosyltransferase family 2 protein [unclassified Thalassospira]|tara:strand:- start:1407 stop:2171 length:765 start_codon:yes stop_codon:yes gene_type:complete
MTDKRPSISVVICAHNEEARLAACLEKVSFADEIVVVCDKCTDRTEEIAKQFGAKTVTGSWTIEGHRRNKAIEEATSDWIFELDADEHVNEELAQSIKAAVISDAYDRYLIPVDNYVGQRLVRYGWGASFGTSAVWRLFKKGSKVWGEQRVHPSIKFTGRQGPKLDGALIHFVDRNISDMIRRFDSYTSARAADLRAGGKIGSFAHNFRRIISRFWRCFVSRKGYKEGGLGFLIALLAALFPMVSYLKARYDDE